MSVERSQNSGTKTGVVIAPNWVGDAVMCLPALRALVAAHADLDWQIAARPQVAGVFVAAARADVKPRWKTIALPGRPGLAQLRAVRREWRGRRPETAQPSDSGHSRWSPRLGSDSQPGTPASALGVLESPQMAVLFPNSMYSALVAQATGARRRVGYARDGRRPWLTQAVALPAPGSTPPHEAFYYLELLRRAGLIGEWPDGIDERRAALAPEAAVVAAWRERLAAWPSAAGGSRVAIHAGASFGHAKRWLPERFAAVARSLAAEGHAVFFIGSREEAEWAGRLGEEAGRGMGNGGPVMNLAGQTDMNGLLAVLSQCQLLIANDSGPMHLAAALGTPVVAIFGSTNARETHPLAPPGAWRLVQAPGIECSPCKRRECPIDHRCMMRVGVEEVLAAAAEMLGRPASRPG